MTYCSEATVLTCPSAQNPFAIRRVDAPSKATTLGSDLAGWFARLALSEKLKATLTEKMGVLRNTNQNDAGKMGVQRGYKAIALRGVLPGCIGGPCL